MSIGPVLPSPNTALAGTCAASRACHHAAPPPTAAQASTAEPISNARRQRVGAAATGAVRLAAGAGPAGTTRRN
ncbi:hypothetical protein OR16_38979 [Cupriavidus basilensis OR16]|uniref:Uncharacterized protein n=1 Tax=Cupriavidus basilensis OR16 TaxID=1127483 RepID=H1SH89_9BURK|nr:hypothetical protein OR16_38979 [Cupriavidus basilensis OR16]